MRASVLLSLLLTLPAGAEPHNDSDPSCDDSGFSFTLEVCGSGPGFNAARCSKRLPRIKAACQRDIAKGKKVDRAQAHLDQLQTIKPPEVPASDAKPKPEGDAGPGAGTGPGVGGATGGPEAGNPATSDGGASALSEGQAALKAGRAPDASAAANRVLGADPKNVAALTLRAQAEVLGGDKDAANADARTILGLDPSNRFAQVLLGGATVSGSSVKSALHRPDFGRAPSADGAGNAAEMGSARGPGAAKPTKASSGSSAAAGVLTAPSGVSPAVAAGWSKFKIGDMKGAVDEAAKALQRGSADAGAYVLRAAAYNRLGKPDLALADADAALKLKPGDVVALLERGYAKYQLGRYKDALVDVEEALKADPLNAMGHLYRGMILEKLDRAADAATAYLRAAELDSSLKPLVDDALARLGLGPAPAGTPAERRRSPLKFVLWGVAILIALGLLFKGVKRAVRPDWATPVTPLRSAVVAFLLCALASNALALCDGTTIGNVDKSCKADGGAGCLGQLQSVWADCEKQYKKDGQPFPPPSGNDANPARTVWNLFEVYGHHDEKPPEIGKDGLPQKGGLIGYVPGAPETDLAKLGVLVQTNLPPPKLAEQAPSEPLKSDEDYQKFFNPEETGKAVQQLSARADPSAGKAPGGAPAPSLPLTTLIQTDPTRASVLLQGQSDQNKNDPNYWTLLSTARQLSGDGEGAKDAARRALSLDPQNGFARLILGHPEQLGGALALKTPFGSKESGRGAVYAGGPRDPAAQAAANKALAAMAAGVGPGAELKTKAQLLLQSAVDKLAVGDIRGALFDVSRALMLEPGSVRARVLRAHISNLPKNHNYEAAIKDADEALKLDPKNAAAYFEKGYALLQLGRTSEALAAIEQGLALEPNNAMGRFYHAMALEKSGLIAKAIEEYQRAAALDPALKPLVDDALANLTAAAAPQAPRGKLPRSVPMKDVLWVLFGLTAFALIFEGAKRVFYKDWNTSIPAQAEAEQPVSSSPGTLPPGTLLGGNFRIEGELARGGIGIVYKAVDVTLKRPVAIKHLKREASESAEVREKFLTEARLAAKLQHPNLAQIYSVVGTGDLYLVFEFVEGETLHERLTRKRALPLDEVKALARDIAEAVDYAHASGVIHRDLKPANVMLTTAGRCKVMDFGIAKESRRRDDATMTQAWGTPPYMAPEQELGSVRRESDLYALGVMLYELIAGRRPFEGAAMLDQKLKGEFPPITTARPGVPPALQKFFATALAPDPANRFHSGKELARALEAVEQTPVRS